MLLTKLGLTLPLVQAPMAGVSTPALAAAVSNAGGLGSISVGATDPAGAQVMIDDLRARTERAFNVNVFVHATPTADSAREQAWLAWLRPVFAEFGGEPPKTLRTIYKSLADAPELPALLIAVKPAGVGFHFGLPPADIDAVVAQGIEAGGHRGVFDPAAPDDALGTLALTRLLVRGVRLPVIAAGGIMDGAGIAAALELGAIAAQLGTAFIACPESSADQGYRQALTGPGAYHTRLTALISGRPARALGNRFTALEQAAHGLLLPDYPIAYDAGKQLHALARARDEHGFGAQWAGQGAPLIRPLPVAELVATLAAELRARSRG